MFPRSVFPCRDLFLEMNLERGMQNRCLLLVWIISLQNPDGWNGTRFVVSTHKQGKTILSLLENNLEHRLLPTFTVDLEV